MDINLLPVINAEGRILNFDTELDFSEKSEAGVIFLSPVSVSGSFLNIGGTLELKASGKTKLRLTCDRCCEEYDRDFSFEISELLKKEDMRGEEDNNPDIIFFRGNSVTIDQIVFDSIYTALPAKSLCKEDCKGLCHVCGKNLNFGSCDCSKNTVDPRFEALDKFFEM